MWRRFYWADGHQDRVNVDDGWYDNGAPRIWSRFHYEDLAGKGVTFEQALAGEVQRPHRVVDFHRADYGYPDGFIGPHRNSDYHEVAR